MLAFTRALSLSLSVEFHFNLKSVVSRKKLEEHHWHFKDGKTNYNHFFFEGTDEG